MSDDHSVWLSGSAHLKVIHELMAECDPMKVRELWKKYAPANFSCPVVA